MLDRFSDRTLEIVTVVVVVLIALVLLSYLAIFINPWVPFNPFQPATRTPIVVVQSTVAPTWTPSPTPTPTRTSTPTPTWTPSPTPTNTPLPTATNTATPLPTNTNTPQPPPPTQRPPTRTPVPTPWPYDYTLSAGSPDCSLTWVWGYVVGKNGLGEPNVRVQAGNDQGWTAEDITDESGHYQIHFWNGPKAGKWFVRVFKGGQPRSFQYWWQTSGGCTGAYDLQQVRIDWKQR